MKVKFKRHAAEIINIGAINIDITAWNTYTLKKTRLKVTQLEKVHFIKGNELKWVQVELF